MNILFLQPPFRAVGELLAHLGVWVFGLKFGKVSVVDGLRLRFLFRF